MTVEITKFLRRRLEGRDSGPMIVTVIPVALARPSAQEGVTENLRKFERLALSPTTDAPAERLFKPSDLDQFGNGAKEGERMYASC